MLQGDFGLGASAAAWYLSAMSALGAVFGTLLGWTGQALGFGRQVLLGLATIAVANVAGAALQTGGLPQLDLLVRTSGEERLSNFLLWEAAYAELYFTDTFWPAFGKTDLWEALESYRRRERRFGRTREQIRSAG